MNNTIVFVKVLDAFMEYLQDEFPEFSGELSIYSGLLYLAKSTNLQGVMSAFNSVLTPYSEYIYECNEDFFLKNSFDSVSNESVNILISKIKMIWTSDKITPNKKAHIWLYVRKLLKYSKN
jgi:hypothetical protein